MDKVLKIGIIGCGAIGSVVSEQLTYFLEQNPDVAKNENPQKPEIKVETTAEAFVEAVLRTGTTLQQAKTAILKMSSSRDVKKRKNANNWRKMHGLPMRRKQKARKKHERGKGADCH